MIHMGLGHVTQALKTGGPMMAAAPEPHRANGGAISSCLYHPKPYQEQGVLSESLHLAASTVFYLWAQSLLTFPWEQPILPLCSPVGAKGCQQPPRSGQCP